MAMSRYFARLGSFVSAAAPTEEDRAAGFELAVASRRFSRRTKAVVEDKLNFSATLMRAGEVEAANRLLAEVEDDVRSEEAALIEKVNEVKVARSFDREPVTRLRLARTMAVAVLGSVILASSAVGMVVVGLFKPDGSEQIVGSSDPGVRQRARVLKLAGVKIEPLRIAGMTIELTQGEMATLRELTSGTVDQDRLETFLMGLLPAALAEKVHMALVLASEVAPNTIDQQPVVLAKQLTKPRKTNQGGGAQPSPQQSQEPEPKPSPSPSDDDGNRSGSNNDKEGDSGGNVPIVGNGEGDAGGDLPIIGGDEGDG